MLQNTTEEPQWVETAWRTRSAQAALEQYMAARDAAAAAAASDEE